MAQETAMERISPCAMATPSKPAAPSAPLTFVRQMAPAPMNDSRNAPTISAMILLMDDIRLFLAPAPAEARVIFAGRPEREASAALDRNRRFLETGCQAAVPLATIPAKNLAKRNTQAQIASPPGQFQIGGLTGITVCT